jgi:hypothetical protein
MSRLLAVARLHTIAWKGTLAWPWLICGLSFVTNLAVFAAIADTLAERSAEPITGGLASIFVVSLVMFVSAVTQVFPYALGLGVTRRLFYAATALVAAAVSVGFALGLYLLLVVENATGGWGIGLRFFGVEAASVGGNNPAQILVYAVVMLVMTFVGMFIGVVYVRWRVNGALTLTAAAVVVPGALAALVTWQGWWGAIGSWLAGQSILGLYAGWPLILVAAAAAAGLAAIRRATA